MTELKTEEQRAVALLSYADAYHIYNKFDENHKQKGACLSNIGSIMMQMGDYNKARNYFSEAIKNLKSHMCDEEITDPTADSKYYFR